MIETCFDMLEVCCDDIFALGRFKKKTLFGCAFETMLLLSVATLGDSP